MQPFRMAAALSTLFLATSCGQQRVVTAIPIPTERMDCITLANQRPTLPPEYQIDWSKVASVGQARAQHDAFVAVIRGREKIVATYIVQIEGQLFQCANDAEWLREREAGL